MLPENKAEGGSDKGHKKAESTKRKMSLAAKGKPKSEEHRKNVAKSLIGRTGKDARNTKSVYCGYLDKSFDTMKECAAALGVTYGVVQRAANNEVKNNRYKISLI